MVGRSRTPVSQESTTVSNEGTTNVHERITTTNMHLIQLMHTVHEWSSRGYTFEACLFGTDQVRCGVGEVDALGTFVVEVVVLACSRIDGRGSRNLDGDSGTCFPVDVQGHGEELDASLNLASEESRVVVHES